MFLYLHCKDHSGFIQLFPSKLNIHVHVTLRYFKTIWLDQYSVGTFSHWSHVSYSKYCQCVSVPTLAVCFYTYIVRTNILWTSFHTQVMCLTVNIVSVFLYLHCKDHSGFIQLFPSKLNIHVTLRYFKTIWLDQYSVGKFSHWSHVSYSKNCQCVSIPTL